MTAPVKNPALYHRMCEPHESQQAAADAVTAFFEDLRAIREKHRIADVALAVQVPYCASEGEQFGITTMTIGSRAEAPHLAAVLFGKLRAEQDAALDAAATRKRGGA